MKTKPIVTESLETSHAGFDVDFVIDSNVTFITGNSGTGKSAAFSFLEELSAEDKRIRCINYIDHNREYRNQIKRSKGKLFVIDNADILLDDKLRQYIALDSQNQYIIIGRNPTGLMLEADEINELVSEKNDGKTRFSLRKVLN